MSAGNSSARHRRAGRCRLRAARRLCVAFVSASQPASINGLNQDAALGRDAKGNITAIGSSGYCYSSEDLLTTAPGAMLGYDSFERLASIATGTGTTRFQYEGLDVVGEFDGASMPIG